MGCISLEGEKLQIWRNSQVSKYVRAGLSHRQAAELVLYVETPLTLVGERQRARIDTLAGRAIDGGLLDYLKSDTP